jgi:hypothetical protein
MEIGEKQVYEIASGDGKVIVLSKVTADAKGQKVRLFEVVRIKWRENDKDEAEEVISRHWREAEAIKAADNLMNVYVTANDEPLTFRVKCVNNLGLEDRFEIGAEYDAERAEASDMLLVDGTEVFAERFLF